MASNIASKMMKRLRDSTVRHEELPFKKDFISSAALMLGVCDLPLAAARRCHRLPRHRRRPKFVVVVIPIFPSTSSFANLRRDYSAHLPPCDRLLHTVPNARCPCIVRPFSTLEVPPEPRVVGVDVERALPVDSIYMYVV